jgi:hypothetical protein
MICHYVTNTTWSDFEPTIQQKNFMDANECSFFLPILRISPIKDNEIEIFMDANECSFFLPIFHISPIKDNENVQSMCNEFNDT